MADWFDTAIKVIAVVACSAVALILVATAINTIRTLIEWLKDEE